MLYYLKVMLKSPTFLPFFLTNLSQKHKIFFLNQMKLGTNSKILFLNPKSNFTKCEKNLQQLKLFLKSYNSFSIFLIFRFLGVLPKVDLTMVCGRARGVSLPCGVLLKSKTEVNMLVSVKYLYKCCM